MIPSVYGIERDDIFDMYEILLNSYYACSDVLLIAHGSCEKINGLDLMI